jgi:hypothetical protein
VGTVLFMLLLVVLTGFSLFSQWRSRSAGASQHPRDRRCAEAWSLVGALSATVVGLMALFVVDNTVLFIALVGVGVLNVWVSATYALRLWRTREAGRAGSS